MASNFSDAQYLLNIISFYLTFFVTDIAHRRRSAILTCAPYDGNAFEIARSNNVTLNSFVIIFLLDYICVILRNGASSWRDVISGVPQGTILGPMFFLLFVNDMPDVVSSTAKMFADDTKLYRNIYSANDCKDLQEDLNALSAWSHHWLLRFTHRNVSP